MRCTTTTGARNSDSQSKAGKEENKYEKKTPHHSAAPDGFFNSQTMKSTMQSLSSYSSWFTSDNSLSKKQ